MLLLPDKLTFHEASDTLRMLVQALKRDAETSVTVDASDLKQFDSSALAVLLECRRMAQALGKAFQVRSAPASLLQLAGLYGIAELIAAPSNPSAA
jgi:phospholipid transport system transporter-binding protein